MTKIMSPELARAYLQSITKQNLNTLDEETIQSNDRLIKTLTQIIESANTDDRV